jgi:signal transduction histidine kinase
MNGPLHENKVKRFHAVRDRGKIRPVWAFVLSVSGVAAGLAARLSLDSFLGHGPPFLFFALPVILAAYYGGRRTGIFTTALSVVVGWYFLVGPRNTFLKATPDSVMRVTLFAVLGAGVSMLAPRIRRSQLDAQNTRQRLSLALAAGGLSVWDWDVRSDELICGDASAALKNFGESKRPRSLADFLQLVHSDDRGLLEHALRGALERDEPLDVEFRTLWPDGSVHWVTRSGRVLRDSDGQPIRMVGVGADITSRKRTEAALRESEASLRSQNEQLQQFAYAAAHDLQEPLRNISIYSQLLMRRLDGSLDRENTEFFKFVHGGARRMEQLLSDLLRYTTAIKVDVDKSLVSSGEAARQAIEALGRAISECDARITVDALPRVHAFPPHLAQLFQNLIGNALKYRDLKRPLEIHVSASRDGAEWVFSVEDNGIGIHPDYHERIFGVFKRLHRREEIEGTGIGLAIAKRIVEHYGGRIWVESEEGAGARFCFTLPAEQNVRAAHQSA